MTDPFPIGDALLSKLQSRLQALLDSEANPTLGSILHAIEKEASVKFDGVFQSLTIYGHAATTPHHRVLWGTLHLLAQNAVLLEDEGKFAFFQRTSRTASQEVFVATWITPMPRCATRPNITWSTAETSGLSLRGFLLLSPAAWKDTIKPNFDKWLAATSPILRHE